MTFFKDTNYDNNKNNKTFKPFYSIKDDTENIFRIAPSCRNLPDGEYAVYKKVHFGYGVIDQNNPDKVRARPFECVHKINYKTKMVEVACPECEKIALETKSLEQMRADLAKKNLTEEYINQATSPQVQWLRNHNLDNKWYCYAKNLSGEWNVLKIGHKTKLALDDLMKRLHKEDGIRALDPSGGVWFKFTKNGLKGPNALTTVEVLKEKSIVDGRRVESIKEAPLTDVDIAAIEALTDVTTCVTKIPREQIDVLVKSGGDPEIAVNVFASGVKINRQNVTTDEPNDAGSRPAHVVEVQPKELSIEDLEAMGPDAFLRSFANNKG